VTDAGNVIHGLSILPDVVSFCFNVRIASLQRPKRRLHFPIMRTDSDVIDILIAAYGTTAKVADMLGTSSNAIGVWRYRDRIPAAMRYVIWAEANKRGAKLPIAWLEGRPSVRRRRTIRREAALATG
jgi:hypothetical protein